MVVRIGRPLVLLIAIGVIALALLVGWHVNERIHIREEFIKDQQETVIVRRRGARDVALLPASELAGLMETAHLLRSPRNARRLQSALRRAEQGRTKPGTAAGLRREILGEARS